MQRERNMRYREKGFTLLEVVISLAILAMGLVTLLHTHAVSVDICNQSKILFVSTILAQEKMGETEIKGFSNLRNEKGDFGEEYPGFAWEKRVLKVPVYADAKLVTINVYSKDETTSGAELTTLMRKGD